MRVKKLEVFGFKSFAQKTTIHFEPGVTAIVGPNGSGKTNLVDAFRWVLGEHNPRDIRAPRLEDVIFNGTDHRAPLSMAEVHLTIDNAQGLLPISFTEVTMTRRVYRSGESECLINQSPCRLKDIQELLLGTGLGGGTYAIIEQDHIDMVLSSKPEERRVVFEEASGVAKYLAKKQETMRRLDEVEEHLVRIADIISEVRRQVSALERAANKARQYKSQWDTVKSLELRLAVDELNAGVSRDGELEQRVQALSEKRAELEAQKQGFMTSLESCNAAVSAMQQRVQELRTKVIESASQLEQHESQITLKTRWIEELKTQTGQLEQEIQQLTQRLAQADEQGARVGGALAEVQAQLTATQAQLGQGSEELSTLGEMIEASLKTIATAKAQLFEAASEASQCRNQLGGISSKLQGLDAQRERLQSQQTQRLTQQAELARRQETIEQERRSVQSQCDELQRRHWATEHALETAGASRHELTGRLHQFRDQLASQRAQVAVLEDLWRRHEGFPDTIKTLMSSPPEGVIGPLVDLLQPLPGYEELVESALGPLVEALVVRDRQALGRCRALLSEQQLEGCRFLVLNDCPSAPVVGEAQRVQAGVSGAVRQYVRTEPSYQPLVDWLLNDSWIIDDIERLLQEPSVPQGRVVSLRGDRWDRRSWRLNGPRVKTHSRVGRKQRWEQARAQLRTLEQEFSALEAQAREAEQSWQATSGQQQALKEQVLQANAGLHKLDASLAQVHHETKRLEEERQAVELELQQLIAERDTLSASLTSTGQAAEVAEQRQKDLERALSEAHAAREEAQQRRQQLLIARAQVEAAVQSLSQRAETLGARQLEIETDREQLKQQLESRTTQRQDALKRSEELAQQIGQHQDISRQLQATRAQCETDVEGAAASLQVEEEKRDQVLPHVLGVEQQLSSLQQELQTHSQQLSERTFRRSRLIERLRELYQIDEAAIQVEQQANPPALSDEQRTSMSEQVQKLRQKLEGIGPVSLGSVEEYDELKRRLEFLQTQQQDLIQARDDLKASITQINRAARAQFRETFERIKEEFRHYYGRLFNGGQADLILMDEEDVLESGIEIVARPPGKRLQNISLLSGGERALTAIALLFALFKVRPSPFCILDEIDAPLDEANVDRFTLALEEFLALSQFILITHNKKTITKADSLYGVTMAEAGVSQILSAKLGKSPSSAPPPSAPVAVPAAS